MKTTVEISDPLFHQAKALASKSGISFRVLIEEGLRTAVEARTRTIKTPFRLRDGSFKQCKGLQPGIEEKDLIALAYGEESSFRQ
ncbi:MAG: hypothetical protein SFV18_05130 [Bryobacteraceae bacterium]|nr:hypothetical protein [Bryobacteraceae bacterium]